MKISVVCKTKEWQVERLKEEAEKLSTELEVIDVLSVDSVPDNLGEVVFWRSSSLGSGEHRFQMMNTIRKNHLLINRCLACLPRATEKSFQQEYVQKKTKAINCIPTFQFQSKEEAIKSIEEGTLRLPFIIKPNKGSKGEGVELINNINNLDHTGKPIKELVFQNFIKNSGDYRVFVLGGRMLGVIKRTAQEGRVLNNISKGGTAEMINDPKILNTLRRIGTTVASIFELTLCGVDVIYDEIEQKFFFLEINTVPQWKGFQEATGINVAREIVQYCKRMTERKKRSTVDLVSEEYQSQIHLLGDKKFHFLSRMYLWSGENRFKIKLDELQEKYIGASDESYQKRLVEIFTRVLEHGDRMAAKEARQMYFKKYPGLEPSLNLLFKNLFVREIYGIDLHAHIRELVLDKDLISLKSTLENDERALRILSTHAINYLYMLDDYLGTEKSKIDPEKLLRIGMSYPNESFELQIYFFTHCIIGASKFYSRGIRKDELNTYMKMLMFVEEIIRNHFKMISLDNKFEFLVCAKICGYESGIEKKILFEANRSLAPDGNFIIDIYNTKAAPDERNDFVGSEHRNVLYMMSQIPFHPHNK
jgi:RimK family alpha-L-glutamate ligase